MSRNKPNMSDVLESMGMLDAPAETVDAAPEDVHADAERTPEEPVQAAAEEQSAAPAGQGAESPELTVSEPVCVYDDEEDDEEEESGVSLNPDCLTPVSDIYAAGGLKDDGKATIYLLEEYMHALPDSDNKRDIMLRLIRASGFEVDSLLNDGLARIGLLAEFDGLFMARTEDLLARYSTEAERIARKMNTLNEMCEERRALHRQQVEIIAAEAARLQDIITFLKGTV